MQIHNDIRNVKGNGKRVILSVNDCSHTGKRTFFMEVQYDNEPHLDFDEMYHDRESAQRAFDCWSKLTTF